MAAEKTAVVRDARRHNFFIVDNELLDIYGEKIGPFGLLVYMALVKVARNLEVKSTLRQLAKSVGISPQSAMRGMESLLENKLVIQEYKSKGPDDGPSVYLLVPIEKQRSPQEPCPDTTVPIGNAAVPIGNGTVPIGNTNKTESNTQDKTSSKPTVSRGKGSEPKPTDPRHQPLVEYIDAKWKTTNSTTDACPWEGHDFRRIDVMLKRVKNWALPVLKQCVDNVYKSADTSPDAFAAWSPPGDFIKILPRYRGGLLDRFGKPLRGTTKPEVSKESPAQKLAKQQASGA